MLNHYFICNNFTGNKIHSVILKELASVNLGHQFYVFIPYSDSNLKFKNSFTAKNVHLEYLYVPKNLRFLQTTKSLVVLVKVIKSGQRLGIDWRKGNTLAYTFWSDGIIALYLNLIFGTKFSVFFRSTDINIFLKYGYYLRPFFKTIEKKASYLCFPSLALEKKASKIKFLREIKEKKLIIPNPIPSFWYENINTYKNPSAPTKKILFVGTFNQNKNLNAVINSCKILREKRHDFELEFIGGTLSEFQKIHPDINVSNEWISFQDNLSKEDLILKYRKSNVFIMTSILETFGMVYLEALSQGCILIHSKQQAIDGFFDDSQFVYSVDPYNYKEIAKALDNALDSSFPNNFEVAELLKPFKMDNIIKIYESVISR